MNRRHDAFGEAGATIALRAEALFAPENEGSELAFGVVVRRLDPGLVDEGPECLAVRKDVGAAAADATKAQVYAPLEKVLHARPKRHVLPDRTNRGKLNSPAASWWGRPGCSARRLLLLALRRPVVARHRRS